MHREIEKKYGDSLQFGNELRENVQQEGSYYERDISDLPSSQSPSHTRMRMSGSPAMKRMVPSVGSGVGDDVVAVPATVGPLVPVLATVGAVVVAVTVGDVVLAASLGAEVGSTVVAASLGADVGSTVVAAALGAEVAASVPSEGSKTGAQCILSLPLTSKLKHPDAEAVTHRCPSAQSEVSSHWPHVGTDPPLAGMMTVGEEVVPATVGAAVGSITSASVGATVVVAAVGAGVTVGASVTGTVGASVGPGTQYVSAMPLTSKLKHPDSVALTHS